MFKDLHPEKQIIPTWFMMYIHNKYIYYNINLFVTVVFPPYMNISAHPTSFLSLTTLQVQPSEDIHLENPSLKPPENRLGPKKEAIIIFQPDIFKRWVSEVSG